ncbi:hypothetical protein BX600DRAFT_506639 [Xylariales sp. PMI_506]|nr:hypothetical protein BX600DRAFT_506639 [Xylariales sp. PMI_506]
MASSDPKNVAQSTLTAWGSHSMAAAGLATLIFPLHARPLQIRPMLFIPVLMFSSYINLQGFKKDSAGITAAASGTYALLALRRSVSGGRLRTKFSARGAVRGAAIAFGLANVVACGWVYATADRKAEEEERRDNPRWAE